MLRLENNPLWCDALSSRPTGTVLSTPQLGRMLPRTAVCSGPTQSQPSSRATNTVLLWTHHWGNRWKPLDQSDRSGSFTLWSHSASWVLTHQILGVSSSPSDFLTVCVGEEGSQVILPLSIRNIPGFCRDECLGQGCIFIVISLS